jgi:ribosome-associated protein
LTEIAPKKPVRRPKKNKALTADRVDEMHAMVLASLDSDQAEDIVDLSLAGKSTIADFMVIASGRSGRQVASMASKIADKSKQDFGRIPRVQGLTTADWVLIDLGDIIVHIFKPEVRSFYALEKMWSMEPESTPEHPIPTNMIPDHLQE